MLVVRHALGVLESTFHMVADSRASAQSLLDDAWLSTDVALIGSSEVQADMNRRLDFCRKDFEDEKREAREKKRLCVPVICVCCVSMLHAVPVACWSCLPDSK